MSSGRQHQICASAMAAVLAGCSIAAVEPAAGQRHSALAGGNGAQPQVGLGPAGQAKSAPVQPDMPEHQVIRSLIDKGQYAAAETAARVLVAQVEAASGTDSLEAAEALDLLVESLWQGGKSIREEARELAERAVAIKERTPGAPGPSLAKSLFHLAALRSNAGAHAEAKPLFERALAIREETLGPEHPDVAFTLNVYGSSRKGAGDYVNARRLLERGLAIREKALGPSHLAVAGSLNNLAGLQHDMHDYVAARSLLERAVAIWEENLGPDHPRVALGVSNLAAIHAIQEDRAGAMALFERALAIQEKTLGPQHPAVAMTLNNLGNLLDATGDHAAAKASRERSLAIREEAFGPEHLDIAMTLFNVGDSAREMGDYAAAKASYQRGLNIAEKLAGPTHPLVAVGLFGMAAVLEATGETDEALALALHADSIGRENVRLASGTLAEREALTYSSGRPSELDYALHLVAQHDGNAPGSERAAWDALVRSRSLVLDEMAARHRSISGAEDPNVGRLGSDLMSAREVLAKLLVRGPSDEPAGQLRELLEQARLVNDRAERALAEMSVPFRTEQTRSKLGLDEVAAALPPNNALVAFALYGGHSVSAEQPLGMPPDPVLSYLAFVLKRGDLEPTLVPLGEVARIDALVSQWREQIDREAMSLGRSSKRTEAAYRTAGAALGKEIWEPLEPHIGGAGRVFVVPDGALHFVNLAALPVGSDRYLIDTGPVLHYLSTERDLVLRDAMQEGEGLLAVGAPAFDDSSLFATVAPRVEPTTLATALTAPADTIGGPYRGPRSACESFASMSFESLPDASLETEEIAAIWNAADPPAVAPATTGRAPAPRSAARILTGAAASEAAVKEHSGGNRILHLATHGFFLGSRCASALDDTGTPASSVVGENPLILAGLALAGANHRVSAGVHEEDGILTAEEVAALDLDGVEWAVLSACDTGAGEVKASEGVFGLRRAFQVAGARTVITSLWAVEDASTRAWMTTLYRNRLTRKLDTAAAVHEASLDLLRERRAQRQSTHPFYWAGFVAVGDWR